jgi:hypothetical protein
MTPEKLAELKAQTIAFYKRKPEEGTGVFRHVGFDDNEDFLFNSLTSLDKPFPIRKVDVAKKYEKLESYNLGSLEFVKCPRLIGTRFEDEDQCWNVLPNGDKTCSGCGSYHPKEWIDWLDKATDPSTEDRLTTTDKGYKMYVEKPGVRNASEGAIKVYLQHVKQYAEEHKLNIEELDKKIHAAAIAGNTKFQAKMNKMREGE